MTSAPSNHGLAQAESQIGPPRRACPFPDDAPGASTLSPDLRERNLLSATA